MQRKVFRVEQMFADGRLMAAPTQARAPAGDDPQLLPRLAACHEHAAEAAVHGLEGELAMLRKTIAGNKRDLEALIGERKDRHMARAAGELGAAVDGMEQATVKILMATEIIDDGARSLSSALKTDYQRGLAQEILDQTVRIYEACNFQDLSGQRIGKVIGILSHLEDRLSAMLARLSTHGRGEGGITGAKPAGDGLLNGPKLDGDSGHASQGDIDALFN